jgi:hypothetical protein
LLEIAQDAHRLFQEKGQPERTALIRFLLGGSELKGKTVVPAFRPPFDIIWRLAQEARKHQEDIEKKAAEPSAACMILLPLLDELRTYCYEHKIEGIPAFLGV